MISRRAAASLLAVLLGVPLSVGAQSATKTAKIEEFFKLTRMDQALKQSMDQTMQMIQSSVLQEAFGPKAPPNEAKAAQEFQTRIMSLLNNAFGWEKLKPEFVKIYAEAFSDKELDDILTFYRSTSGQAMVEHGMALMPKVAEISQRRIAQIQPQLQKLIKEMADRNSPPRPK